MCSCLPTRMRWTTSPAVTSEPRNLSFFASLDRTVGAADGGEGIEEPADDLGFGLDLFFGVGRYLI